MPLKRLSAEEIRVSGTGERLAIGIRTTRKKKKPPISKTTEPTCNHWSKGLRNIIKILKKGKIVIGYQCFSDNR